MIAHKATKVMEYLLTKINPKQTSVIMFAVDYESPRILQMLLKDGRANPALPSNQAIRSAVMQASTDSVRILLGDKRVNPVENGLHFTSKLYKEITKGMKSVEDYTAEINEMEKLLEDKKLTLKDKKPTDKKHAHKYSSSSNSDSDSEDTYETKNMMNRLSQTKLRLKEEVEELTKLTDIYRMLLNDYRVKKYFETLAPATAKKYQDMYESVSGG